MHSFSYLEPVCCSMSSSNCCFLTCIEVSQEAGQVFWYSHLFQKSRNTWSNRQIWPWSKEWNRAKANKSFAKKMHGHSKHPLPTTQEKTLHMDITRWSTPKSHWFYSLQRKMEKLYTVSKNKIGSWLWLRSWTPYYQIQTWIEENRENH